MGLDRPEVEIEQVSKHYVPWALAGPRRVCNRAHRSIGSYRLGYHIRLFRVVCEFPRVLGHLQSAEFVNPNTVFRLCKLKLALDASPQDTRPEDLGNI